MFQAESDEIANFHARWGSKLNRIQSQSLLDVSDLHIVLHATEQLLCNIIIFHITAFLCLHTIASNIHVIISWSAMKLSSSNLWVVLNQQTMHLGF